MWISAEMISVVLALLLSQSVLAATYTIVSDTPSTAAPGQETNDLVNELKMRVIKNYLQSKLESRYAQIESKIEKDFIEKYISTYRASKQPDGKIKLEVDLDTRGLNEWVRLYDTKSAEGGSLKPVLLVSSRLPSNSLSPEEFGRSSASTLYQAVYAVTSPMMAKFGFNLSTQKTPVTWSQRPRTESEIQQLGSQLNAQGFSAALWVNLMPCKRCGGARMDTVLYFFPTSRAVALETADLALSAKEVGSEERLKTVIKAGMQGFQTELEKVIGDGKLTAVEIMLSIQGMESPDLGGQGYKAVRQIETEVAKLDAVRSVLFGSTEGAQTQFKVLTTQRAEDLANLLQTTSFPGFQLKTVGIDSQRITMRYSK